MIWATLIIIIISIVLIVQSVVKDNTLVFTLGYILLAIILFLAITIYTEDKEANNTYITIATAEDANYLKTKDGNIWRVKEDLEVGKEYEVKFDSKGIDNVIDDEILEIE